MRYNINVWRGWTPEDKEKMKIGTRVSVKTKHYGKLAGTVIAWASYGWIIKPDNHPRNITANPKDIKVIR